MSDGFLELEAWAQGTVAAMGAAGRARLAARLARDLRRSQAERIARQENPDGTRFEPRKPQAQAQRFRLRERQGRIRRRTQAKPGAPMFRRLRTAAFLRADVDGEGVWAGFTGRAAAIAVVHQEGREDRTSPEGPVVRYPMRRLLGFTDVERQHLAQALLDHLAI